MDDGQKVINLNPRAVVAVAIAIGLLYWWTQSSNSAPGSGATVKIGSCWEAFDGSANANLLITNDTSSNSNFYVDVGFFQNGKEFSDNNSLPDIAAGSTYQDTITSINQAPGLGKVTCKVLQVNNNGG